MKTKFDICGPGWREETEAAGADSAGADTGACEGASAGDGGSTGAGAGAGAENDASGGTDDGNSATEGGSNGGEDSTDAGEGWPIILVDGVEFAGSPEMTISKALLFGKKITCSV